MSQSSSSTDTYDPSPTVVVKPGSGRVSVHASGLFDSRAVVIGRPVGLAGGAGVETVEYGFTPLELHGSVTVPYDALAMLARNLMVAALWRRLGDFDNDDALTHNIPEWQTVRLPVGPDVVEVAQIPDQEGWRKPTLVISLIQAPKGPDYDAITLTSTPKAAVARHIGMLADAVAALEQV